MNDIIIQTGQILVWLVLFAFSLGLLVVCITLFYRVVRHVWGATLLISALREHHAKYPEKWKKFDRCKIN